MEAIHASKEQQLLHEHLIEMIEQEGVLEGEKGISADGVASSLIYHPMELTHLPSSLKLRLLGNASIMGYLFSEGWAPSAIPRLAFGEREVEVNLSSSDVDDHFLHQMAKVPVASMTTLILSDCQNLTDAGLHSLAESAPNLTHIDLRDCENLSREGVNQLRDLGLTVEW